LYTHVKIDVFNINIRVKIIREVSNDGFKKTFVINRVEFNKKYINKDCFTNLEIMEVVSPL